ncbi:CoA transferase [Mycolicibacterium sp.]|uniref:CoA transferase n=1 Tax=Mycolicibacterium sp. TaxID=2320850 RepID=UPI0037CC7F7D
MTGDSRSIQPLSGFRVIDFGQYIAGPATAMILCDLGADVIRVDPPGGPRWDSPATSTLNRGKRSIVLNLKDPGDQAVARRLVESADVVVENFRPGVMDRLGLGADLVRAADPRLVYLSMPGFSSLDPRRALPAWEGIVLSATGGYTDMGLNRVLMGINPSYTPLPLASAYAAALGALAVSVALYDRESSGVGDHIEVPLTDAVLEGLAYNSLRVDGLQDRYLSQRELEIERRRRCGEPMDLGYEQLQELLDPFYRSFRCADGRMFYHCCPAHRTHATTALKQLGLWNDVKDEIPLHDPYTDQDQWPAGQDCTLLAYPLSAAWSRKLAEPMKTVFASRTSDEWEALYDNARIPGAAHRSSSEWMHSEHARAAALMVEVDDPRYGRLLRPGPVVWTEASAPILSQAPVPDADRAAIVESLDARKSHIPPERRGPSIPALRGVRILDLTNVIAGPTIGSTLARFGATVTKIDPTVPTFDPYHNIVVGLNANRGKRSALVDLKTPAGRQILDRLIENSDVVTFNGVTRQMRELGLEPVRIRAINPAIAIVRIDAYGGQRQGPRSEVPGYDDNVQACTGIMTRFGGAETPEEHAHLGTIDALAGFLGGAAAVIALLQQQRHGTSDVARVSLAAAGQFLQVPFMYDHPNRAPFDEPSGRAAKGERASYRCYPASDGWLFLAGRSDDLERLRTISEFAELPTEADDAELVEQLSAVFECKPVDHWCQVLDGTAFAVHRVEDIADLKQRNTVAESAGNIPLGRSSMLFIRHDEHPIGRWVDLAAPNSMRFDRLPIEIPTPAPRFGEHTIEILTCLGYDRAQIDELIETGVVADRWTPTGSYLPV